MSRRASSRTDEARVAGRQEADRDLEADDALVEHVLAHHLEAVGLDHRVQPARAAVGGELEQVAHAVFRGRDDVRRVEAVAQPQHRACCGQRMVGGHHRADRLGDRLDDLEIGEVDRLEHQREVAGEGGELALGGGAVAHAHREGDAPDARRGSGRSAAAGRSGSPPGCRRSRHGRGARRMRSATWRADAVEVAELAADVLHQQLAGRVQPHAARQALEDLRAELRLEGLDAPVQRRGGDVQILGRLADRAGAGDVADQSETSAGASCVARRPT